MAVNRRASQLREESVAVAMIVVCGRCGAYNGGVPACWRCAASLPESTLRLGREPRYTGAELHFADGTVVPLVEHQELELGRAVPDRRIAAALGRHRTVSRRHATVLLAGRMLRILDHNSRNGTFVDATEACPTLTCPLQPLVLGLGQSVQLRILPISEADEVIGE
jgi:hypothetical protein